MRIALGLLLAGFVATVVLGVVFVLAGSDSTETSTDTAEVDDAGAELTPSHDNDAHVAVEAFADAWEHGDWAEVTALSSDSVTATAQDWYVDGHLVEVVDPATDRGAELLVTDPLGGSALIFNVATDNSSGSALIVDLSFGGDAG